VAVYVVFLRGINVGAQNRVAMQDLRTALQGAGYADATTHLNTGNVVLSTSARSSGAVEKAVEEALRKELELDVAVMARSARELDEVVADNPLLRRGEDTKPLAAGFLKSQPAAKAARAIAEKEFDPGEEFALRGAALYLRYPNGLGRSKMTGAFFERALDTPLTVRNWSVVTKLAELASAR
jgi:uncharacterized protein (DUF1697 family)